MTTITDQQRHAPPPARPLTGRWIEDWRPEDLAFWNGGAGGWRCATFWCPAGVGGGNFASSMAHINSCYPQRRKGRAPGLNAGGGNIGVAVAQLAASPLAADNRYGRDGY